MQIVAANPKRAALYLYNNSANTIYVAFDAAVSSANHMTLPIATFATWTMPLPVYTGAIYGIRNAGSGSVIFTEMSSQ